MDSNVTDYGCTFSTDNINVGSNPFNAIAAHGVGYYNHGLSLGTNNIEAGPPPYNNAATTGLTSGAFQEATVAPNADNNLNDGIGGPSNYNHNGASCLGRSLGNVSASGIAYDQSLSAALSFLHSNGVYPTGYVNTNSHLPKNGTTIGTAHGSSDYATIFTPLGAQSPDNTSVLGSTPSAPTTGFAGDRPLQASGGVSQTGFSNVNYSPSNPTASDTFGTADGNSSIATSDTARSASTTPTTSSALSPSASDAVTGLNGRPRWPCTTCAKTFSRQTDMVAPCQKAHR